MAESVRVELADILYRTRGRDWDYSFLLQPPPLLGEGWYTIHRRIFANVEPSPTPLLLRGALGIGTGQPFLATAFVDPELCDYQARPVAHYLVWLGKAAEAAPGVSFGPTLVAALQPALRAVFELSPDTLKRGEIKALDTLVRERFQAALATRLLTLSCEGAPAIRWLGTLAV